MGRICRGISLIPLSTYFVFLLFSPSHIIFTPDHERSPAYGLFQTYNSNIIILLLLVRPVIIYHPRCTMKK